MEALITLVVIVLILYLYARENLPADFLFLGGALVLTLTQVITPKQLVAGFSNPGLLAVGSLYLVASGLKNTGAIERLLTGIMRPKMSLPRILGSFVPMLSVLSAFINNTPVVSAFAPSIEEWGRKKDVAASKLLIPVSYAAILGGTITVIGTSTNLIVDGLYFEQYGQHIGFFDPAWVGLPLAVLGWGYIIFALSRILPDRRSGLGVLENVREYTVEMLVVERGGLVGKTIEQAELRGLQGLFLAEIVRDDGSTRVAEPNVKLRSGDRLIFTGLVRSMPDLHRMEGLVPANDQVFKLEEPRFKRNLVEAVIGGNSPSRGKKVRDVDFRKRYNAVILAVCRNGERVESKIGDIELQSGDVVLLEAASSFYDRYRDTNDFLLINPIADRVTQRNHKVWVAWAIFTAMLGSVLAGWLTLVVAAMSAGGLMVITRCTSIADARKSVDWTVLIVIGASIAIGKAAEVSGLADLIVREIVAMGQGRLLPTLAAVYIITWFLTEVVTNNAAAVFMYPFVVALSNTTEIDLYPLLMVVIMAASASFMTPIGYQTNLMVYGPGGYRFSDYVKAGWPLVLLSFGLTIGVVSFIWA